MTFYQVVEEGAPDGNVGLRVIETGGGKNGGEYVVTLKVSMLTLHAILPDRSWDQRQLVPPIRIDRPAGRYGRVSCISFVVKEEGQTSDMSHTTTLSFDEEGQSGTSLLEDYSRHR